MVSLTGTQIRLHMCVLVCDCLPYGSKSRKVQNHSQAHIIIKLQRRTQALDDHWVNDRLCGLVSTTRVIHVTEYKIIEFWMPVLQRDIIVMDQDRFVCVCVYKLKTPKSAYEDNGNLKHNVNTSDTFL